MLRSRFPSIRDSDGSNNRPSCSFVKNHKKYLLNKGYMLNNVYSLKRNKIIGVEKSEKSEITLRRNIRSENLPPLLQSSQVKRKRAEVAGVWHPDLSRDLRIKRSLYPKETNVRQYAHKSSKSEPTRRLGNTLTSVHLRALGKMDI